MARAHSVALPAATRTVDRWTQTQPLAAVHSSIRDIVTPGRDHGLPTDCAAQKCPPPGSTSELPWLKDAALPTIRALQKGQGVRLRRLARAD